MKKLPLIPIVSSTIIVFVVGAVVWWFINPKTLPPESPPPVASKYDVGAPDPDEMLELINQERAKVGVAPLTADANVERAAQLKSDDFVARNYYDHTVKGTNKVLTPEMNNLLIASCSRSSENINASTLTSKQTVDKWLASPPHKKAILDPAYSLTGFGVSLSKENGYYSVQYFCVAK